MNWVKNLAIMLHAKPLIYQVEERKRKAYIIDLKDERLSNSKDNTIVMFL
jgi:hypothetical protein